ncbi:hypothetical protein ACHAPD_004910 [Fusarium lateritium]
MASSFKKLAKLADKDALKSARIPTNIVAGGVSGESKTESLVTSDLQGPGVPMTADSIKLLTDAYKKHEADARHSSLRMVASVTSNMAISQGTTAFGLGESITVAAGDLFNWLRTGIEKVVNITKSAATGFWEFVVQIGKVVYRAVLNIIEAVVGVVEWAFNKTKTGVEKVIRYVEFLLKWDDIRRTKQVAHNLVKYYLYEMVSGIETAKEAFDEFIVDAMLDVLYRLAGTVVEVLDAKIHIPIISDIPNAIGIPDISFLD